MSDRADDAEAVAPAAASTEDTARAQEIRPHQDVEERNRPDPVDPPELGAAAAGASPAADARPDTLDWGPDPDAPSPGVASTPAEARPPGVTAAVEPPSPDVALAAEASPLPGAHRGGFQRLPTAPVSVTKETAPAEPGTSDAEEPVLMWLMPENPAPHRGLAAWALAFSAAGLLGSIFVGWGFPIGLVGVISAILALRRPLESRTMAVWALVLGVISVLYSAGWLFYAASRANLFG